MGYRVTYKPFDAEAFEQDLARQVDFALYETATFDAREPGNRIPKRQAPDGSAQKPNAASTVKKKGHDLPLWDKGNMANPSSYVIEPSGDRSGTMSIGQAAQGYTVTPDAQVAREIVWVRGKGFRVFEITDATEEKFVDEITRRLARLRDSYQKATT